MADENENETQAAPVVETPAPAPTPSYVPADEFKTFQATIADTLGTIRESLQALNSSRVYEPAHPAAPSIEDASDEEIESALAEGKGAKVFRKAIDAAVRRLDAKYDARHNDLEQTAGTSLSGMAARIAKPLMKHYEKPYIKREVDAYISKLPAKDRLNPESYVVVYNAIAGAHLDEIIADEREAALRAAANNAAPKPGSASGRANSSPTEPTVEETFGVEAARELRNRGRSIDRIAQAFGFEDGKAYMKAVQDAEGSDNVH